MSKNFWVVALVISLFSVSSSQACTDFGGFWEGICTDNLGSPTDSVTMSIQQFGCAAFRDGATPYVIGSPTTSSWGASTRTTTFSWDANQSLFNVALDIVTTGKFSANTIGTLQIVNDQLVFQISGPATITESGVTTSTNYEMTCTYDLVI
jgi:hypothetical protein